MITGLVANWAGPRRAKLDDLPTERGPAYKPMRSTVWTGQTEDL